MEIIIATEVFDHFGKTYLLDRIKGSTTTPVLRITETVHDGTRRGQHVVEMDAAVLKRILRFMEVPSSSLPNERPTNKRPILSGEQCATMVRSYLKGVSSEALAMQYGCKAKDIEDALRREGIAVVDQSPPTWNKYQHKWRRK